jgi:nucleotide-binding universal stress UspA family protein
MNEQQLDQQGASRPRIVVGVDGSPDSVAAIKAAAWAAAARGGTVTALHAWAAPLMYGNFPFVLPEVRDTAKDTLRKALHDALGAHPLVQVDSTVTPETPAAALVAASEGAELLVVGSRGHGGFGGLLIGSVSMACAMHAHCPVLVVHAAAALTDAQEARSGARVVVGVGHGLGSVQLLRAAGLAADELDAELLAVTAWQYPGKQPDGRPELRGEARATAERRLEEAVSAAFLEGRPPKLRTEVHEGSPAAVLVHASRTADLVVVGRIGHSPWAGVMLGSVSLPVAEHAECSVLVIPGVREPAPSAAGQREVAHASR